MNGTLLRCYLHEDQRLHGQPAWEALIQHANESGIRGGSVFKAMAGFGHHHIVHEGPRLFDPHAAVTVEVEFLVTDEEARQLLTWVQSQGIRLFYATIPAMFATVDAETAPA